MTLDSILSQSDSAVRRLENRTFDRDSFEDFVLPHRFGAVEIHNVHFDHCTVSPGTCMLSRGVILQSVRFTEFACGDAMHIAASVKMIDVTIEGTRSPTMIWIRSGDEPVDHALDYSLDVSRFGGELWIDGVPIDQVTRNVKTQIVIDLDRFEAADWDRLGIHGLSYWRIAGKKVRASGARKGIASLPPTKGRNYDASMRELQILQAEGVLY